MGLQLRHTPRMQLSPTQQPPAQLCPSPAQLPQPPATQEPLQQSPGPVQVSPPVLQGTHWPVVELQLLPTGQGPVPQVPPQPSGPHSLPPQAGAHTHWPAALQGSTDRTEGRFAEIEFASNLLHALGRNAGRLPQVVPQKRARRQLVRAAAADIDIELSRRNAIGDYLQRAGP